MKVSTALLDTARDDAAEGASTWSTSFSHLDARAPSPRTPGRASGCTAATAALMRRMQRRHSRRQPVPRTTSRPATRYADGCEAAAPQVRCPVTLVLGARDQMTPAQGRARDRRGAEGRTCVTLPCGHNLMAEDPTACWTPCVAAADGGPTTLDDDHHAHAPPVDPKSFKTFAEFYPFYLARAQQPHLPPAALRRARRWRWLCLAMLVATRPARSTCSTACCAATAAPGSGTSASRRTSRPASSGRCTASWATG